MRINFILLTVFVLSLAFVPAIGKAQEALADVPFDRPVFSIYPAKVEVNLSPGEQVIRMVRVINTLGYDTTFELSVEDIGPSANIREAAKLYGEADGPFSVKSLVDLPYSSVFVKNGETKTVPIAIKGPPVSDVGGRYGVVLFSVSGEARGQGQSTKIVSRLGATLLIKSAGSAEESVRVLSFGVLGNKVRFYDKDRSVISQVTLQNDGNIHINTYGLVVVKNIFGREVAVRELDPWYVLPGATRLREVSFGNQLAFGLYSFEAKINRGYADKIDEFRDWIIVLPAPWISIIIMAILIATMVWFAARRINAKNYD